MIVFLRTIVISDWPLAIMVIYVYFLGTVMINDWLLETTVTRDQIFGNNGDQCFFFWGGGEW